MSSELLGALVFSFTFGNTRWHHIQRPMTPARLGWLLLRVLLARGGLGFALVHCERTCVDCCNYVDHHHPTHYITSAAGPTAEAPILYNYICVTDAEPVSKTRTLQLRVVVSNQSG